MLWQLIPYVRKKLVVVLVEKSRDPQIPCESSSEEHECLHKILWQSIVWRSWYLSPDQSVNRTLLNVAPVWCATKHRAELSWLWMVSSRMLSCPLPAPSAPSAQYPPDCSSCRHKPSHRLNCYELSLTSGEALRPCLWKLSPEYKFKLCFWSSQAMESKLLVGGKNIIDHTNEQQKMLEGKRHEIAEQVKLCVCTNASFVFFKMELWCGGLLV